MDTVRQMTAQARGAMKLWDAIMAAAVLAGAILAGAQLVRAETLSAMTEADADDLLRQIVQADIISSNCDDFPISDDDWQLLNSSANFLAAQLGLGPSQVERDYYGPTFDRLDQPGFCDLSGSQTAPLVARLRQMGR